MVAREAKPAPAQRIGAVLPQVLRLAEQRHNVLEELRQAWGKLVGKPLAGHSKPVSLRRGRLVVHVDRPGDGFTLHYDRERLLARLKSATKAQIDEIVFRPGELS